MSRKHSKVSNNNVRKSLSLSTMIEKSDKIISTATQFNEKTSKLEKSSRLIPRKTTPTQQRLFKRQPTTMTKHQQQQHHSQQSSKKLPKNSIAKMMTKRRQSTMKSLSEDDSIPKKISIKKLSTTIMRNKHSIMATTKTSIKTNDDNNNNNNNMNVRMNCSSKQKRQRDDSKQTVGARTTTQQQDSAIKSRQPIKETTITQQTSPEKLTATATTTKTASKTTSENPLYIMDENQMLELFKSFLKNISYQQKLQRESASSSTAAPPTNREKTFVDDKDELEELNAEMIELFGHINTVQSSYQEIVQSLISIQKNNRRHHRTGNTSRTTTTITKQPQLLPMVGDSKCIVGAAAGTGAAGAGGCELKTMTKEMIKTENPKPITLEPFMNPSTRNESFNQLFQRVDRIRTETEQFRTAFTSDGTLQRELYDNNKITFGQYKYWHEQIQELAAIVELILQEYNREVLELFRLSQTPSEY